MVAKQNDERLALEARAFRADPGSFGAAQIGRRTMDISELRKFGKLLTTPWEHNHMRSRPTSSRLTLSDAIEIWKRRHLGEAVHSIAAGFRVNPARIAEVLSGRRFPEAERLSLS